MKKLKYIIMEILIPGLGLNSCSKDNGITESYINDLNAVQIIVYVNNNKVKSNPVSNDSDTRKTFKDKDKITVSTNDGQSAIYTLNSYTWNPSDATKYIKWENSAMIFSAFYPAHTEDNNAGINTFTLPIDQSTSDKIASADYMTAITASKKQSDSPIDIKFIRKTALINIKISEFGNQYSETQKKISNVKIYSAKINLKSSLSTPITPYTTTEIDGYGKKSTVYSAIVLPTNATEGKTFITLIDGAKNQATAINIPEAKAGYSYTYLIKVGKNKISIISAKEIPWIKGTTITEDAENRLNTPFGDSTFEAAVITKMKEMNSSLTITSINTTISDQKTALAGIDSLCIYSLNIKSLSGIEYLTGLTYLDCQDNKLTKLIMPDDTLLTELYCYNNSLKELDVSKNTGLTYLYCYSNSLTKLNVSNNKELTTLSCDYNILTELDVSNNIVLKNLYCNNNRLSTLNYSNISATTDYTLYCGHQTSDGTNSQDLILTLDTGQVNYWNNPLSRHRKNTNVIIVTR